MTMATQTRTQVHQGVVHWIDHYVVCTTDVERWGAFHAKVLGGITEADPQGRIPGIFQVTGRIRYGGFVSHKPLPPTRGLGKGLPRYGYYIEASDIERHLRRLDEAGAVHGAPVRTAAEGEPGTAIYWQDPDGNQFEFWAPDVLPEGAMAGCGPERVGRISHIVLESRDLDRTAAFFDRYCKMVRERNAETAADTLVLRCAGGARLVYKRSDELQGRTTGCGLPDTHVALLVRSEDFFANYARVWAELPEFKFDPIEGREVENPGALPARTVLHPSPGGRRFHALTHRGDDFFDWDTNLFHFYGGTPVNGDSMAVYDGHSVEEFVKQWEREHGNAESIKEIVG
jgi:predicted enzyme related to lactoylglutathione lyase